MVVSCSLQRSFGLPSTVSGLQKASILQYLQCLDNLARAMADKPILLAIQLTNALARFLTGNCDNTNACKMLQGTPV